MGLRLAHFSGSFLRVLNPQLPQALSPPHFGVPPEGCAFAEVPVTAKPLAPTTTPGVPSPSTWTALSLLPQPVSSPRRVAAAGSTYPKNAAYPRRAGWGAGAATAVWFPRSPFSSDAPPRELRSCGKGTPAGTGTRQEKCLNRSRIPKQGGWCSFLLP